MSALPECAISCDDALSIEAFEKASVNAEQFDHEAHVHVAWLYLKEYELEDAIVRFSTALRRLTKKLGVASKYHETITWFFMILIGERMMTSDSDDWPTFRKQNKDLFSTAPSIIQRYYSSERLGTALARRQFLLPDKLPR
jgi:hypothetical protein